MLGIVRGVSSNPLTAGVIGLLLIVVSLPLTKRVASADRSPQLASLMMASMILHLLAAPAQLMVIDHVYHGITDYTRYVNQGAQLAARFDSFHFSLAGTGVKSLIGEGTVSLAAGIVFSIVGINKLAGFLVFGWLAFIGSICFYRAFSITFPEANRRRYAKMVFFLPSLLFWTAGIAKETLLYFGLGIAAYGAARVLARQRSGFILIALGTVVGIYVRPHEYLLLFAALVGATMFRPKVFNKRRRWIRRAGTLVMQVSLLGVAVVLTQKLAHSGAPVFNLQQLNANNSGQSSSVGYSSSPAYYWRDVYTVLLDPLPFNFHGGTQLFAACENSMLAGIAIASWRRLKICFRVARARPYVMLSLIYCLAFCYVFPALGNLGLIERERVLMLPFLLVLFAVPISDKGEQPQYAWEMTRPRRRDRRRSVAAPVPALVGGTTAVPERPAIPRRPLVRTPGAR